MRWNTFILSSCLAACSLFCVSLFWQKPMALAAMLMALSIAILILGTWNELFLYLAASVSGAGAEAIAIYFGAWTYALPAIGPIPLWLPLLWGMAAVFLHRMHWAVVHIK